MMKLSSLAAGMLLLWACSAPEEKTADIPKNSDWVQQNLKGMVQSITTTNYTPDSTGAIGEPDSCCATTETYDERGYSTSMVSKTSAGVESNNSTMSRYEGGQMKTMVATKDGKPEMKFEIELDANGKYSKATRYDSTGTMDLYYTDITEDEYGNVLTGVGHKPDGSVKESFSSTYKGPVMVQGITKDSAGNVTNTYDVELNDKQDMIKSTSVDKGKDSTTTTVRTFVYDSYDDAGNWTQRTTFDEKGKAIKVVKRVITYHPKKD